MSITCIGRRGSLFAKTVLSLFLACDAIALRCLSAEPEFEKAAIAEATNLVSKFEQELTAVTNQNNPKFLANFKKEYLKSNGKTAFADLTLRHFGTNDAVVMHQAKLKVANTLKVPATNPNFDDVVAEQAELIRSQTSLNQAVGSSHGMGDLQETDTGPFAPFGLGAGLSLTVDVGSNDRVERARIETVGTTRYLRVEEERNAIARFVLETHYFFEPKKNRFLKLVDPGYWGHGPFIAVEPGGESIINAVGAGWMIGFKRKQPREQTALDSFNLGVGVVVDPSVQVLGDGQKANQEMPDGAEIRYKTKHQIGVLIMFSVGF